MNYDREIVAAALRWHSTHAARLEASTESNKFKSDQKKRTGFVGSDYALSRRVAAVKRTELAAMCDLAKVCAKVRQQHIDDAAEVLDVDLKLISC